MRSAAQFLIALSLASQAICVEKFALFTRTKNFTEMAEFRAQHFIDVIAQLLQRPFGSRNTADQKLNVQQQRPMPVLQFKTGNRSFQRLAGTDRLKDWHLMGTTIYFRSALPLNQSAEFCE